MAAEVIQIAANIAGQEGAKILFQEGGKVVFQGGAKALLEEAAKVAAQEGMKTAAKEGIKEAAQQGAKVALQEGAKVAAQESAKLTALAVPGVGLTIGIGFAVWRIVKKPHSGKSYALAAAHISAGAASMIPGVGTAASLCINAGIAGIDIADAVQAAKKDKNKPKNDPKKEVPKSEQTRNGSASKTRQNFQQQQSNNNGHDDEDWDKWDKLKRECNLNVSKEVIEKIKKHIEKHKNVENEKIKVDKNAIARSKDRDAIEGALKELAKKNDLSKKPDLLKNNKFRLEQGRNKGNGQWEIQRNGMAGHTNVAEVISVDGFPDLINNLPMDKSATIWNEYNKLILQKLIESLRSFDENTNEITKVFVSFKELLDLLIRFLKK